jgi:hypothetical protein
MTVPLSPRPVPKQYPVFETDQPFKKSDGTPLIHCSFTASSSRAFKPGTDFVPWTRPGKSACHRFAKPSSNANTPGRELQRQMNTDNRNRPKDAAPAGKVPSHVQVHARLMSSMSCERIKNSDPHRAISSARPVRPNRTRVLAVPLLPNPYQGESIPARAFRANSEAFFRTSA